MRKGAFVDGYSLGDVVRGRNQYTVKEKGRKKKKKNHRTILFFKYTYIYVRVSDEKSRMF